MRAAIGLLLLAACSAEPCLPGDIDCADLSSGGKEDGFDYKNDPARMSQTLNYRLAELPLTGKLEKPIWRTLYPEAVGKAEVAWADTYWPTFDGSHNARWQGPDVKSPLEKYDEAFNQAPGCQRQPETIGGAGAMAAWEHYEGCAGPAAKWQSRHFQNGRKMHDGLDNDGDGLIDARGPSGDIDGIASWWGTCHAWSPASLTIPEPQHAVTVNGVRFEVGDIKALIQNSHDTTSSVMLGGRCNAQEVTRDSTASANDDCLDLNPGGLHVVLTNFLGLAQLPLIEDRTSNLEVWHQPVVGYEITKQEEVGAAQANACVGATGSTWSYNDAAKTLYDVRLTIHYITEGEASLTPIGFKANVRSDRYHYILEVNDQGKVIGGRYCSDSALTHPDFLWSPTGKYLPSNPHVKIEHIDELVRLSVK